MWAQTLVLVIIFLFGQETYADIQSKTAQDYFNQAMTHKKNKQSNEAINCFLQGLAVDPLHFKTHFYLAGEYYYREKYNKSIEHYKKALKINPQSYQTACNLGIILAKNSTTRQEAYNFFSQSISYNPNYASAYFHRGRLSNLLGNYNEAESDYRQTIALQKNHVHARAALAKILRDRGEFEASIDLLEQALELEPKNIHLWFDLGFSANMIGEVDKSISSYEQILQIVPRHPQSYYNIGYTLKMGGDLDGAIAAYQKALTLNPHYHQAQFALSLAYLNQGTFQKGWKRYAQEQLGRGKINQDQLLQWFQTDQLQGKHIFLRHQGGLGDVMQFVRFVKELKKRGAYTIVLVSKALKKLLSRCSYIDRLLVRGDRIPPFDTQTTLMALPAIFNPSEQEIPAEIPYIFSDPKLTTLWKKKVAETNPEKLFKVGLCWTADEKNDLNRPPVARRSIPLELLAPLAQCKNVVFYSLQKENPGVTENFETEPLINTWGPDFDTQHGAFMDTAALIENLDLVISVDTSIAHLAGALGAPVWLVLPFSVDWRWIAHRTDSPWYPTMQIFKQELPMDWSPVIHKIANELQDLTHSLFEANLKLGQMLSEQHQNKKALYHFERALSLRPCDKKTNKILANNFLNLGNKKFNQGCGQEALQIFKKILSINPNYATVHHNIAFTLAERLGRHDEAIKHYKISFQLHPDNPETHFCYALSCLATGNMKTGWKEYLYRWKRPGSAPRSFGASLVKQWKGEPLNGKTILIRCEQGLGDTLHFIRYAQLLKNQGATVTVEVQKPLAKILSLCSYIDQLITIGSALPNYDYQIPLLDLPALFETTLQTIPTKVPYLYADNIVEQKWKTFFKKDKNFKVGICWNGDASHGQIKFMPLKLFAPLMQLNGVMFYSLQKFNGLEQIADLPQDVNFYQFDDQFDTENGSFMDTAAVMKHLDLVITADTSIAHLAGGLGVPTWVILPFPAEWRWLIERDDSPWYPTMKLFRQTKINDWNNVQTKLLSTLKKLKK